MVQLQRSHPDPRMRIQLFFETFARPPSHAPPLPPISFTFLEYLEPCASFLLRPGSAAMAAAAVGQRAAGPTTADARLPCTPLLFGQPLEGEDFSGDHLRCKKKEWGEKEGEKE